MVEKSWQIQSSNHERIFLLGVIHFTHGPHPTRSAEEKERELHLEFKHLCPFKAYARGAEWFHPSAELLARIEEVATKPEALGIPEYFTSVAENGVEFS
jgi:hypothetical protein